LVLSIQLDDRAIDSVMKNLFKNYKMWCKFLGRKHSLRWEITISSLVVKFKYFVQKMLMVFFHIDFLKVSKRHSSESCFIWGCIFLSGVKHPTFASCLSVCATYSTTWVYFPCDP